MARRTEGGRTAGVRVPRCVECHACGGPHLAQSRTFHIFCQYDQPPLFISYSSVNMKKIVKPVATHT